MLISSGSPKAFQEVIYHFWTGQHQPRLHRASRAFEFKGQKCVDANEVHPQFFAPREGDSKLTGIWIGNGFVLFIKSNA